MPRKVFISFLGSGFYGSCQYASGNFVSGETRFVQQATLEWIKDKDGVFPDETIILLTGGERGSRRNNWDAAITERENRKTGGKEPYSGLETALAGMELPKVTPVEVPDGKNEEEIWQIFETVFHCIRDGDQLYFDLTHGFRYLPMLLLVLGNYATFLKKAITLTHISYGNFEVTDKTTNIAPFVDLLPLAVLQDWATAANNLLRFGNAELLHSLTRSGINPVLKRTGGQDQTASDLRCVANALKEFADAASACRCPSIFSQNIKSNVAVKIDALRQQGIIKPLTPVLEKIQDAFADYADNDVANGIRAARWCLEHNMLPQGYTILQETMVTLVLEQHKDQVEKSTASVREQREFVSALLSFVAQEKSWDKWKKSDADIAQEIAVTLDRELLTTYDRLTQKRNDINHGGTGGNASNIKGLADTLSEAFAVVANILLPEDHA